MWLTSWPVFQILPIPPSAALISSTDWAPSQVSQMCLPSRLTQMPCGLVYSPSRMVSTTARRSRSTTLSVFPGSSLRSPSRNTPVSP